MHTAPERADLVPGLAQFSHQSVLKGLGEEVAVPRLAQLSPSTALCFYPPLLSVGVGSADQPGSKRPWPLGPPVSKHQCP